MIVSGKKLLVLGALAAVMAVSVAAPVHADWDDRDHYRHEWREHHWYRPVVVAPQPYYGWQVQPRVIYVQPQPVYAAPVFPYYGMNAVLHIH